MSQRENQPENEETERRLVADPPAFEVGCVTRKTGVVWYESSRDRRLWAVL